MSTGDIFLAEWTKYMTHGTEKWRAGPKDRAKRHSFVLLPLLFGREAIEEPSFTSTYDGDMVEKGGEKKEKNI